MKKTISILSLILFAGIFALSAQCCSDTPQNKENSKNSNTESGIITEIKVYYFHATRRCVTCQAVESVTIEALKEYYGDKVSFESINRETDKDNSLVEKYKISGQSLLITNDEKMVDLTNYAFMNARNNPDKLKLKIKETIDSML